MEGMVDHLIRSGRIKEAKSLGQTSLILLLKREKDLIPIAPSKTITTPEGSSPKEP